MADLTDSYNRLNEIDPELFRKLILGDETAETTSNGEANGIMSRYEPVGTKPAEPEQGFLTGILNWMRGNTDDPERLADAIVPETIDLGPDLSNWEAMPELKTIILPPPPPVSVTPITPGSTNLALYGDRLGKGTITSSTPAPYTDAPAGMVAPAVQLGDAPAGTLMTRPDGTPRSTQELEQLTPDALPNIQVDAGDSSTEGEDTPTGAGLMSPRLDSKGQIDVARKSIESSETYIGDREVQEKLTEQGFTTTADGQIGNNTRKNIGRYQASIDLPATGVIDRDTQQALNAAKSGLTEQQLLDSLDFVGGTAQGRALMAAEEMVFNPYSINGQPILRGNRRHNSGLTIGVGVDLGQQSAAELRRLQVPAAIITKLEDSGWLGLQPVNAAGTPTDRYRTEGHRVMKEKYDEQARNGELLTLTPQELDTLTATLYDNKYLPAVRRAYDSTRASERVPFSDLSDEAIAALGAEAWHYTSNVTNNAESFATAAAANDLSAITALYLYPERGPAVLRALR